MTKSRSQATIISKGQARSSFVNKSQQDSVGPGQYATYKEFGKDVKGYGFGKPKPEKTVVDNRDYGYSPEKEFKELRHKSPAAVISKAGARGDTFAPKGQGIGPGQYEVVKEFGKDVKGHGFGKPQAPKKVVDNRDYNYSPEKEFA